MLADAVKPDTQLYSRLDRIEGKVDKLGEGFIALVRAEERIVSLFTRLEGYEREQYKMAERLAQVEMVTIGRGYFFRWLDRGAMALVGAAAAYVLTNMQPFLTSG